MTGGAGFIGSHLVETLVQLGAYVTVLDNFSTGNLRNLRTVVGSINLVYADIRSIYGCSKASTNQDLVFHLAALVSVPESFVYPQECFDINLGGTENILAAAQKNGVSKLIFSSSSAIYGNNEDVVSESCSAAPLSPYAESKYKAELACKNAADKNILQTASLRYFNVFGDRQNPNGHYAAVVAKFSQLLLEQKEITIYGDGLQTRDFIPVEEVVTANLVIGMGEHLDGSSYNIASGKSITILELLQALESKLGIKNSGILFAPARSGDITHSQADCSRYKAFCHNLTHTRA